MINSEEDLQCHCGQKFLDVLDLAEHKKVCLGPVHPTTIPRANDFESAPATFCKLMDDATLAPGDTDFPINFDSTPILPKCVHDPADRAKGVKFESSVRAKGVKFEPSGFRTTAIIMLDPSALLDDMNKPIEYSEIDPLVAKPVPSTTDVKSPSGSRTTAIIKLDPSALHNDMNNQTEFSEINLFVAKPVPSAADVKSPSGSPNTAIMKLDFADHKNGPVYPPTLPTANDSESAPATFCKLIDDATLAPSDTDFPINFDSTPILPKCVLDPAVRAKGVKFEPSLRAKGVKFEPSEFHTTAIIKLDPSALLDDMNKPIEYSEIDLFVAKLVPSTADVKSPSGSRTMAIIKLGPSALHNDMNNPTEFSEIDLFVAKSVPSSADVKSPSGSPNMAIMKLDFADHKNGPVHPLTLSTANDSESAPATFCKLMDDATLAPSDTDFPINFNSIPILPKCVLDPAIRAKGVKFEPSLRAKGVKFEPSEFHTTAIIKLDPSALLDDMNKPIEYSEIDLFVAKPIPSTADVKSPSGSRTTVIIKLGPSALHNDMNNLTEFSEIDLFVAKPVPSAADVKSPSGSSNTAIMKLDFADHKNGPVHPLTLPTANDSESAPATFCKLMDDANLAPSDTDFPINFDSTPILPKYVLDPAVRARGVKFEPSLRAKGVKFEPSEFHTTVIIKLDPSALLDDMNKAIEYSEIDLFVAKPIPSTADVKSPSGSRTTAIIKLGPSALHNDMNNPTKFSEIDLFVAKPVPFAADVKSPSGSPNTAIMKLDFADHKNGPVHPPTLPTANDSKSAPATFCKLMDNATLAPGDTDFPINIDGTPVSAKIVNNSSGSKIVKMDLTSDMDK